MNDLVLTAWGVRACYETWATDIIHEYMESLG